MHIYGLGIFLKLKKVMHPVYTLIVCMNVCVYMGMCGHEHRETETDLFRITYVDGIVGIIFFFLWSVLYLSIISDFPMPDICVKLSLSKKL